MVEMLIRSGVHRYAEFVLVDRILTYIDDKFRSVLKLGLFDTSAWLELLQLRSPSLAQTCSNAKK